MINPYAEAFMIATRTDFVARPRMRAEKESEPVRRTSRLRRLFGAKRASH